jgi:two-component system cell cycle response regulator DivK
VCKVLLVDDEEDVLELARTHLSAIGHEIHSASNGEEALRFLTAHEDEPPCILVTDLRMPVLDGWDLVHVLKLDARWTSLPIIVCSGSVLPGTAPPVLNAKAFWSRRPTKQQLEQIHEHCARHHRSWPPLAMDDEIPVTKVAG